MPRAKETGDAAIYDFWLSALKGASLSVADELVLFDRLSEKGKPAAELARELGVSAHGLDALLRVLAGGGFVAAADGGRSFGLSELSEKYLRRESPLYWGAALEGSRHRAEHLELLKALRSNGARRELDAKASTGAFARRIGAQISPAARAAAEGGAFAGVRKLLDVGGGVGSMSAAAIARQPGLRCTVFDLPEVCAAARSGLAAGITLAPGDFFKDPWPAGHDAVLLSNVLHNWPPEACASLAAKAYACLPKGGRVIVHEMLLDPDKLGPLTPLCFSLLMYMDHGAQQFTAAELRGILEKAGFSGFSAAPSFGYYSIAAAVKT